jgi:hypothetical protein
MSGEHSPGRDRQSRVSEEKYRSHVVQEFRRERRGILQLLLRPGIATQPGVHYLWRHDTECVIFDPWNLALRCYQSYPAMTRTLLTLWAWIFSVASSISLA